MLRWTGRLSYLRDNTTFREFYASDDRPKAESWLRLLPVCKYKSTSLRKNRMKARPAIFEQQYRDSYKDHRLFENLNGNYYFSKLPFQFSTWNGKLGKCNMRKIRKDLCAKNEIGDVYWLPFTKKSNTWHIIDNNFLIYENNVLIYYIY